MKRSALRKAATVPPSPPPTIGRRPDVLGAYAAERPLANIRAAHGAALPAATLAFATGALGSAPREP